MISKLVWCHGSKEISHRNVSFRFCWMVKRFFTSRWLRELWMNMVFLSCQSGPNIPQISIRKNMFGVGQTKNFERWELQMILSKLFKRRSSKLSTNILALKNWLLLWQGKSLLSWRPTLERCWTTDFFHVSQISVRKTAFASICTSWQDSC